MFLFDYGWFDKLISFCRFDNAEMDVATEKKQFLTLNL